DLRFLDEIDDAEVVVAQLRSEWPSASVASDAVSTLPYIQQLFYAEKDSTKQLPVLLRGTNFQIKVWEALLRIPAGRLVSYDDVARSIGQPTASRAVGTAIGSNRLAYLIPCHRVLQKSGGLGGYRWGTARKQAMMGYEAGRLPMVGQGELF
uniref:methylated-DNA--[protein]-cysteine S-methyltransferase n=1 Tax=Persicitalea sp. TaxID=3100273 RepID=UPI0035947B0E